MWGATFPEFILGFIESRGVEVVHIMNSRLGFDLLPDMTCLPRPPAVVVQMHAEEPDQTGYVRYVTRRYGNLIDAFSVTSEHLKSTVAGYEIPPSRIDVIHSGVDAEVEFNPRSVDPLRHSGNGVPRILWPGRLVEQKDPMLTLDVVADARSRGGEFMLDVVGDGYLEAAARERADRLGIADSINWHPPSQEMARWYRSSDLLLMTSVFEGVPYVIYEALAMGVPVVAPALPGNVEFMDEDSGALIEPRDDASRYAEVVVALLADEERRRAMGRRSRERMIADFSLAEMGRRHDRLYERLLESRPATSSRRGAALTGSRKAGYDRAAADMSSPAVSLSRDPAPERTVGVVIPCHRHGLFLADSVRSAKKQSLAPSQIVVVDDGSDDPETIDALELIERDPEVTVLRQVANRGPSSARNRAIAELDTSYVLPLDADDELLPGALELMVGQIERASGDVGFVYPHAQHMGNRSDFIRLPAYNLWLLMQENYCPAPALFDRRVFASANVEYAEDIVVGHEDWDLILQLAERGIRGVHAVAPTFLYRRQGFSRVNAVDYGPHTFHDAIKRRHPALYLNSDRIKADWAPALSLVLLDDGERSWKPQDLSSLEPQTCADFEVLAATDLGGRARLVAGESENRGRWVQSALRTARGRWVCLLTPASAAMLESSSFVERLLYCFKAPGVASSIVFANVDDLRRPTFAQLDDAERLSANPVAVSFARSPGIQFPGVHLPAGCCVLSELAINLQTIGAVQWRFAGSASSSLPMAGSVGGSAEPAEEPFDLDIGFDRRDDPSDNLARQRIAWQPPRLPELTPGTVRRWEHSPGWTPAETQPLCRHLGLAGQGRVISNDRNPPPGYALEFDLGVTRLHAAPGTRRLIQTASTYRLTDEQNHLGAHRNPLGYIEDQPLPLLEALELRRMRDSGEMVLVAGRDDPLFDAAERVRPWAGLTLIRSCPAGTSSTPASGGRSSFDAIRYSTVANTATPASRGPGVLTT